MGGAVPPIAWLWAAIILVAAAAIWWLARRLRHGPDRERKRRLMVNRFGRMGDAVVTDVRDDVLYYSYEVRGVGYIASQDISGLHQYLPAPLERLIGHAGIKYDPRNPANSIMVCEDWSGIRQSPGSAPHSFELRRQGDSI